MIKTLSIILLLNFTITKAQNAFRLELVGHWNDTTLPSQGNQFSDEEQTWNDLIGWTHPQTEKEFIIMGSIDSTYFFDISNPSSIKKCAAYPGKNRVVNRDYDVYKNYVYCVSDNGPAGVLQIFDLQYLPDSVHLILEDSSIANRVHSLFVDSNSKRLYFQSITKGLERHDLFILSLDTPERPTVIGELKSPECGRVHEAYYRNDTAYCSCETRGLHVFDMQDADSIKYLGGISPPYPYNGYNHTSWVDNSGKFIAFTDEIPTGLPIKLFSMNKARNDFDFEATFNSNIGATPHNVIWVENILYTSAYQDGIVMWDMSNPYNPTIRASYDTHPQNPTGVYDGLTGCWGIYPFFKSGIIAATDMVNGLFLVKYNQSVSIEKNNVTDTESRIFPNPFNTILNVHLNSEKPELVTLKICSINGQLMFNREIDLQEGENELKLEEGLQLTNGMYILTILRQNSTTQKLIVKY